MYPVTLSLAQPGGSSCTAWAGATYAGNDAATRQRTIRNRRMKGDSFRGWVLLLRPGPDACDPIDRDPGHVSGRRVRHRRELHVGAQIGVGESLEQLGGA